MCRKCAAKWEARAEADRRRIAAYADKARMTWAQWAAWLTWYEVDVTSRDREWSMNAYLEHGCTIPYEAYLGDHPELELSMNTYLCQFEDDD